MSLLTMTKAELIAEVEKLKADVDSIARLFKDTKKAMQARIDELEEMIDYHVKTIKEINRQNNIIKAEGIEEMLKKFRRRITICRLGNGEMVIGENTIKEYANKLRGKE